MAESLLGITSGAAGIGLNLGFAHRFGLAFVNHVVSVLAVLKKQHSDPASKPTACLKISVSQ